MLSTIVVAVESLFAAAVESPFAAAVEWIAADSLKTNADKVTLERTIADTIISAVIFAALKASNADCYTRYDRTFDALN